MLKGAARWTSPSGDRGASEGLIKLTFKKPLQ